MKRRGWGLLGLIVVFVGLLALTLAQRSAPGVVATPVPRPTATNWRDTYVFPDVTVRDILTLNLRDPNGGATFTLSRAPDGTWTAPGRDGTLDTEVASASAQALVLLDFERVVTPDAGSDLTQYGFTPNGRLFIEFLLADETAHVIAVGGLTSDRQAYYLLVDDRPGLYVSARGPVDYLIEVFRNPPLR